ncbi:PleD family two-component system response regulator [Fibrobacterota bacterium]
MDACPGRNATILVIDDDRSATKLLKLNLEVYGFNVLIAISGRDGLAKAFSELPEAIILDVRMPDLNGWHVCERLKNDPRTAGIPVLFLTAYSQETDFEKSQKLGASLFLTKPFDPEELVQKIRGILEGGA